MAETVETQLLMQQAIGRSLQNLKKLGTSNWTKSVLRTRIVHLQDLWRKFEHGYARLLSIIPAEERAKNPYFKEDSFAHTEEVYLHSLSFMTTQLDALNSDTVSPSNSPSDGQACPSVPDIQLPRINVPQFDGKYEDWEAFRDKFSALIIQNPKLHDVTRLHYLVSALTGRALDCIGNLSVTADNFQIAWKTLSARYDNPRRIITAHLSSLQNLPALSRESAADLQTLCDRVCFIVDSLKRLGRKPEELWNDILVHQVSQKLDTPTRKAWKLKIGDDVTPPSFDTLMSFIGSRSRGLEEFAISSNSTPAARPDASSRLASSSSRVHSATASKPSTNSRTPCPVCRASHNFSACPTFLARNSSGRRELAQRFSRCFNCLSNSHSLRECNSKNTCRVCNKRHHSLLHEDAPPPAPPNSEPSTPPVPSSEVNSHLASTLAAPRSGILLATAWVQLRVPSGRCVTVRALIDQGSETSFVTEAMVHLLRAKRTRVATSISAVGGVHAGTVRHAVRLHVAPRDSASPSIVTTALVLTSLSTYMPKRMHNIRSLEHLSDLNWADADPSSSAAIHLILGADIYPSIILDGLRKGSSGQPIAQKTIFGWVISGPITSHSRDLSVARGSSPQPRSGSSISMHHCIHQDTLSNELRRFWEIEEIPSTSPLTQEEEQCERHFQTHTSRAPDGQYIVRLPFRTGPPIEVGHSRSAAEKVLQSISRKLLLQPSLTEEYEEFLREYEALGHMRRVPISPSTSQCVYIPHHPVLRADSVTTHLRVVFNASSVTSNGSTLNDHLLPGPKLQLDLSTVILRWRTFRFVYTADIAKMYRQILVDERDVDYQRILWRPISSKDTQAFQLLTVTYGMTCAPFLALRVLQQLIEDDGGQFPLAVPVLRSHIYVDDVLFGGNDLLAIRHSRDQLIQLLQRGHMKLRKWASNSVDFLADIDPEDHGLACSKNLAPDDRVKILGISWNPSRDSFQFKVSLAEPLPSTKRAILSTIAKLYDPLGWVTPAIISAKIFIQGLWRLRIGWDDQIPPQSLEQWKSIHSRLPVLNGLQISRWIGCISEASRIELHGFADASTVAYAAVVFARCISSSGTITVSLLAGKSKVAPLTPVTIPRLELQAAVLLARLMKFVSSALDLRDAPCYCWTDSTVALAWLQSHPSKWKTFVANRVADVQTRLPHAIWRHVPTADNPADCASRGLLSDELLRYHLWWKGPAWLPYDLSEWPTQPRHFTLEDSSESKVVHHSVVPAPTWDLDSRFSSWPKLIRVTAYIQRFVRNSRSCRSDNRKRHPGRALSASECTAAKLFWLRRIQESQFAKAISSLSNGEPLPPKDPIESLHPFLDETGLLRVGGRLRNSPLPHQSKHPVLLSPHPLVRLIIEQAHARALHAGVQLTLHILRQEYWLLRGRSQVKAVIHACVRCVRERAAIPIQLMGDLPAARVSPAKKPFSHCGLDYAGPIQIRASAGRGITSRKAYIALFVCMSTKAVHLELVADYSTSAFLNAYTRFCSRRGLPERMYSDNGTTFVGANRELVSAYRAALRDPDFQNRTASDGVAWHFIPPSAPHFGGLWEAGVKSVKHHLRRVLGDRTLTFEEFTTLLCAIEACLNSRPIAPLSDTLDDYEPLTPGHFLIGSALTTPPQPSLLDLAENRLSRWQLVRHTTERFWKLWQNDYLNTLQQRGKWRRARPSLSIGQLVLLRNPTLPPCKWELGRIVQLHPGDDDHTRVVTIKTATACFKRPIVKLVPLPVACKSEA
ncbi:uncharacterized protein LOC143363353 [Halictus rubicundus]|uniref:uncharacterized protein LOC143363353 n=1 Tax=Halictus rubicundus TaxID=77578 RepID=UPI004036E435